MIDSALSVENLGKTYPGVTALDGVSLHLRPGEVHALLGENGAGKSTLLKIVSGDQVPRTGTMRLHGQPYAPQSPQDALRSGVVTVHQEFSLIPELSIAENIFLGRQQGRGGFVSWHTLLAEAGSYCRTVGLKRNPREIVRNVSVAEQQLVEIARGLSMKASVLILDEPTATLSEQEVTLLFDVVRRLQANGCAIAFVTHRLKEVFELCQRYTVLRDGRRVATGNVSDITQADLVQAMVGRNVEFARRSGTQDKRGRVRLRVEGATHLPTAQDTTSTHIENVSFTLHEGEILGIAGLVGSGRTQLARCIFGADKLTRGSVEIDGREATPKSPREAIASGIALVPEDRKAQGLFLDLAVRTNFSISILDRLSGRTGLIARTKERELFERYRTLFGIRLASHLQPVSGLSGGNQQKVVMARWMALDPGILIVDEPTRGVDVGAKAEIYDLLFEMAGRGMAILAISSEIPELLAISDRILVMRSGRIQGELAGDAITESGIGEMMLAD